MIETLWTRIDGRGHALALSAGAAGGAIFYLLGMPLAWMMGAMVFVTIAALAGWQPFMSRKFRAVMVSILGVFLGSAFSPDVLDQAAQWGQAFLVLVLFIVTGSLVGYQFLRRVGRFNPTNAYFASAPGGLSEMALAADDMGGDMRTVSLCHTVRILCIIMIIPFWYRWVIGADVPSMMPEQPGPPAAWLDWAILVGCAVIGWPLAVLCRIPAAAMVGPMILSAAAHLSGMTHVSPPPEPVAAAQVVLGTAVGCRFAGSKLSEIWGIVRIGVAAAAILLTLAVGFTLIFGQLIDVPPAAMLLILSPGGLAEMSLIALALGIDIAFVSTMQLCRIMLIIVIGPSLFRLFRRPPPATDS